jgi:tetratricopeptide (TPR) repeat protein
VYDWSVESRGDAPLMACRTRGQEASMEAEPGRSVTYTMPNGAEIVLRQPSTPTAADVAGRYLEKGLWEQAIAELEKARRSAPDDAEVVGLLGSIYLAHDRYADAVSALEAATRLAPDDAWWHFKLGVSHGWAGNQERRRTEIETAVSLRPDFADGYAELGQVYHDEGRASDAIAAWEKAVALGSEVAEANYNLGGVYFQAGRNEEAVPLLETAARTGTDVVAGHAHWVLARVYQALGRDAALVLAEVQQAAERGNESARQILSQ